MAGFGINSKLFASQFHQQTSGQTPLELKAVRVTDIGKTNRAV